VTIFQAIILGLVQGITEFLPISSSGHLILVESFLGLHIDELKDFDVALHVGTLLAILLYFRRDLLNFKLWPYLIFASVPAALVGFFLEDQIDALFRSAQSVGAALLLVGLLFFIPQKQNNKTLTWGRALAIGCAQACAIIPGVSRSGSTLFTGMQLGMKREDAARFSFLLGSIAIAGAGLLKALRFEALQVEPAALLAGFLAAFASSLFAVSWLMNYLKTHSLKVFGIYRVIVGALIILFLS
jgi:undecaprenyl-diphosphatase